MSRMSSSTACMPLKRAKRPNLEFCTMPAWTGLPHQQLVARQRSMHAVALHSQSLLTALALNRQTRTREAC